ncbi:hypothetical protein N7U66_04690 [Lacinutrix neustonica]|uniref:Lipoprotein n=1 Tax=Lacinutrix neustonica TaxID=2980107 RepID=A0A9E8MXL7_9FLAO|nr:hypothetical protein [Lacinutrix neustonica]WAC02144.1 hypothetical protein N7U66_20605 [Lacinutrix neustonica]WAC02929.1 hypothetical protein N7U66_04690 [Lacinutrix neustonica]
MKISNLYFIFLIIMFFSSCDDKKEKFNQEKWDNYKSGIGVEENRLNMVDDLIKNYIQKGMTYKELTNLIGQPENYANLEKNTIGYELIVDYGWDIDPVEDAKLLIEISQDSIVTKFKIEYWNMHGN